jgi:DNA-binding transcriptional regulator GbsR (MarR family)
LREIDRFAIMRRKLSKFDVAALLFGKLDCLSEYRRLQATGRTGFNAPPGSDFAEVDKHAYLADVSVMTETTSESKLHPAVQEFVLRWGDLGGQWGVNRSVAQIQALLILSERPLNAEEIAERLGMARSNVSNSLKELLIWKLIHRAPVLGDRRDFYAAETDMWQMANKVAQGRKEREIDPMLAAIDAAMAQVNDKGGALHPVVRQRLADMHGFIHTVESWYRQMLGVPPAQIMRLIKLGAKVVGLLRFVGGKGDRNAPDNG